MTEESEKRDKFNFDESIKLFSLEYEKNILLYEDFSKLIKGILEKSFKKNNITINNIELRTKSKENFIKKASKPSESNPNKPKYPEPLRDITDLAGVRVITFFLKTIIEINKIIYDEFIVKEKIDKSDTLIKEEKLGYQSVHYVIQLKDTNPEYEKYKEFNAEIQVRTILQHAWAEIEHDIQYKSIQVIPQEIKRRFMDLVGLLEIADREFQDIYLKYKDIIHDIKKLIKSDRLVDVEITQDSIREYLNKKIGSDDRIRDYSFIAKILIEFGFLNLKQVDDCIKGISPNKISKILHYSIQGQTSKFEDLLLVGMGEEYIKNHRWGKSKWFIKSRKEELEKLKRVGVPIGSYNPKIQ